MTEIANRRIEDARLMVVDDQEANTQMLERMLRRSGFAHARSTTDPEQVLALHAEFHPDLILLDLHMPKLDGFAVMTQLSLQIPSDDYLPILVLTADANPEAKQRALSLGAKDFLIKPFDRVEVLLRIKKPPGDAVPSPPVAEAQPAPRAEGSRAHRGARSQPGGASDAAVAPGHRPGGGAQADRQRRPR